MQKLGATSKTIDIDSKTIFVPHMCDYFLKNNMIKRNKLIISYNKTQTR